MPQSVSVNTGEKTTEDVASGVLQVSPVQDLLSKVLPAQQILAIEHWPAGLDSQMKAACLDQIPAHLALPQTTQELAAVMALAHQQQWRILVVGQGSKLSWGALAHKIDLVVSTQKLNRLVDHAVGDMTVTVEAGMRFAKLQALLAQHNQWLPLDPTYPDQATLGGILSTRDAGSLRHRYGSLRDLCLGLSFVRSDGQIAKAGGRVVKNVAGYDLMKLFSGAYGTLGIVTEITLRVYPLLEKTDTVLVSGSPATIAALAEELLQSTLTPVILDIQADSKTEEMTIKVQFQSLPESVSAQIERFQTMAKERSLRAVAPEDDAQETAFPNSIRCQVGVLSAEAVSSLAWFRQVAAEQNLSMQGKIYAGSGLGQLHLTGHLTGDEAALDEAALKDVLRKWRSHCEASSGFLSILEAPITLKQTLDVWGYSGNALGAMRKLKEQFDPQGLLNPGRFVGGI